jgi:hypothetical protein
LPTQRRCRFRHCHHCHCCHHHCCPSQATAAALPPRCRRTAATLPPHFPPPSLLCHRTATIDHFGVGTKYHFAHVEPKIPKSSKKDFKRIKAQKLRNARQILDLAIPDKIWPRSQKPNKNEGRHPVSRDSTEKNCNQTLIEPYICADYNLEILGQKWWALERGGNLGFS